MVINYCLRSTFGIFCLAGRLLNYRTLILEYLTSLAGGKLIFEYNNFWSLLKAAWQLKYQNSIEALKALTLLFRLHPSNIKLS